MARHETRCTVTPEEEMPVAVPTIEPEDTKAELQRRMHEAHESIAYTVAGIKDTVEDQYATAKDALIGILDWREQFRNDPVVWSVGALSAGFALGYTLGAANRKGRLANRAAGVGAFADSLVQEISTLGKHLPLTALDPTVKRVLGFDLSQLLGEMDRVGRVAPRKDSSRRKASPRRKLAPTRRKE